MSGGASLDSYVTGNCTMVKDEVQQLLKNRWLCVIRTQQFQSLPFGEISGKILYQRKKRVAQ
jgi:hypothetical protein